MNVSGAGDVNVDGYDDVITGSNRYDVDPFGPDGTPGTGDETSSNEGRVRLFSGKDGSTLLSFVGENPGDSMAANVSGAGDLNLDGTLDFAAWASGWDADPDGTPGSGDEKSSAGRVYALSGKDASILWTSQGSNVIDKHGVALSDAGDVNLDGAQDLIVSESRYDSDPDGTPSTGDEELSNGRIRVISSVPLSLTADAHELSLSVANSQTMTIDAGVGNAGGNYWLFTGFAASGDTPGVTMAPGVVIPLNQPDPLTSFVIGLTQLGGGAPTFAGWKSTLDGAGQASPSLNTFGPTPAPLGVTLHHAALVYTSNGCGTGCDTFQLATNWVPMTTTP